MKSGRKLRTSSESPGRIAHETGPGYNNRAVGAASMRAHNRSVVLRLVYDEVLISRADIARRTGLSRSTVSGIATELVGAGLLREAGAGQSMGGKPPRLLGFHDERFGVLGVDIGASHIGIALMDLRGTIHHFNQIEHHVRRDPEGTQKLIVSLIKDAVRARPTSMRTVIGIGVAVPCPIDPNNPNKLSERVLPRWKHTQLHSMLTSRFGVPVRIDNDANLGALAERWWGAGKNSQSLAYVKLGTGIGCGLLFDGQIHRGARSLAGEFGHLILDPQGPECDCGSRGCLVTFIGAKALVKRAASIKPRSSHKRPRQLKTLLNGAECDAPIAMAVMREAGNYLALGLTNLINLINPDTVILGGRLAASAKHLVQPARDTLKNKASWTSEAQTSLVVSELGEKGIALGAATHVLVEALQDYQHFEHQLAL
jgi:predicted NBD/HSP70 family sugar kinase